MHSTLKSIINKTKNMKTKTFYAKVICSIVSIFIFTNSFGADETKVNANNSPYINMKVKRAFIKLFGEESEQNWSITGQNFLNRFHVNGVLTNALFSKNGQLIYTITYGTEKQLPAGIRKMVKGEYIDYSITAATEIMEDKRDIWVVQLQNDSEVITVRIENREMEQVQQFYKSK